MTEDEQEAESLRYSHEAFYILPLSSGKIAILTPRRDLFRIVETWEEAKVVGLLAEAAVTEKVFVVADLGDLLAAIDLEQLEL